MAIRFQATLDIVKLWHFSALQEWLVNGQLAIADMDYEETHEAFGRCLFFTI